VTTHKIKGIKAIKGLFKKAKAATTGGGDQSATGGGDDHDGNKVISLEAIDRIQRGATSRRFLLARQDAQQASAADVLALLDEERQAACLSIVYYRSGTSAVSSSSSNNLETLDLIVPNSADYEVLLASLEDLVSLHQEERQRFSPFLQLLHHYWVELGKEWHAPLSLGEFLQLCDKLQVPVKRGVLTILFKEDVALLSRGGGSDGNEQDEGGGDDQRRRHSHDDKMPFLSVAQLLETIYKSTLPKENVPVERLWRELSETDPVPPPPSANRGGRGDTDNDSKDGEEEQEQTISAVAFLSFLRSHQKEFSTSIEEATDLVKVLNHQVTHQDLVKLGEGRDTSGNASSGAAIPADRLTKSRFLAFLTSDANDLLHPALGVSGAQDMTHPLPHYWINTSHDTYLDQLPNSLNGKSAYSKSKGNLNEQMYSAALLRGVRCLELDVWDGLDGREPVVAKQRPTQPSDKRLAVDVVLKVIRQFLLQNPYEFPILLKIENHGSTIVQQRLAKLLSEHFGKDNLLLKPQQELDVSITLPSPEQARGKVIIIGKRPKTVLPGRMVRNDDFDVDNDYYDKRKAARVDDSSLPGGDNDEDDEDADAIGVVVGFSAQGPVRSHAADAVRRSPAELAQLAEDEAASALNTANEAQARAAELEEEAKQQELRANHWAIRSGLSPAEVKRRAAGEGVESDRGEEVYILAEEEKSTKEEGLEVHDILPEFVEGSRVQYQKSAQDAMDSAGREAQCLALLREKEEAHRMAKENLEMAKQREASVVENAKRAATEARENFEHAEVAKERVEKVRELLQNSRDQSSSAGTVVQTAHTEAKISEKRAAEAEARAARAAESAEADRNLADDETRKEEIIEQEVNSLHEKCLQATEAGKKSRERVEKAAAMLERVNEQIRLIETSSQYRKEVQSKASGGSFLAKHSAKIEEREMCRELIKEATEENTAADASRKRLQRQFEERAQAWKLQADIASQSRRKADRSSHVAEELEEHAAEEREAADLRHTARQRAEATVDNRNSCKSSIEAQLQEAERAASEAAKTAVQSRKRADHLAREAERVTDHTRFEQIVEKTEWERKQAQAEYDSARMERERKDKVMMEEKRRFDTNSDVYKTTVRDAAVETDRVKEEQLYQQEAVNAYKKAVVAKKSAHQASEHAKAAAWRGESLRLAAERAKEYKKKMEMMVQVPVDLARLTMIHSTRHKDWTKSLSLSNSHMHSFAQNVILHMVDKAPDEERRNLQAFTKNHLVRVFPSWKAMQNKTITNYDPVFSQALGCQLVASNFHSTDESLLIAEGRFRQNGSCGYVLKPAYLNDNVSKMEIDQRWSFQIISGHNLPKPVRKVAGAASPLVKISIYSGSAKETRISYRTRPIRHGGLNPVWTSNNRFEFVIPTPSVSMICFSVWHGKDDGTESFMAASAFPACCLREGFRSVALFDDNHSKSGAYLSSSLLIKAVKR